MQHSDLMQFKDEMLKNLREMERKIMSKVNKTQTDISSDLNSCLYIFIILTLI